MIKVIARIKGGLGNQLFCYAVARRVALVNDAELVIDDVSGFVRDRLYGRRYMLDHFIIPARKATPAERLEPFERYRRGVLKWWSRGKPFTERRYLVREGMDFDSRLLSLKVKKVLYMDGVWQSENYFKDIEQTIREDLRIIPPTDALNQHIAEKICNSQAVALHVRWFDVPGRTVSHNIVADYYRYAVTMMERKINSPCYFVFSDNPEATRSKLALPERRAIFVLHNRGDENAYADLWLMTRCKHFIIANSTFSWWGAWLGKGADKIVICPGDKIQQGITMWGFKGLLPKSWIKLLG
ncbi:MAG: alpha-1,2-fucosyltransferase [Syntrophorhabdaceae bacterium]|jgi:hypothetical protein|nr:alpha-1,2-fucosyltransferase [Syntrophorhabdaceae bacterium]